MKNYWSVETNPETGRKFEKFLEFLRIVHDGTADIDGLISSEYGQKFAELLQYRFLFEEDPMGEACLDFYRERGVKKEMFHGEDYYGRYAVYTPLNLEARVGQGKKYPVIFYNHGGGDSIETDEFPHQLPLLVNQEQFILVMPQNTNWDNFERLLKIISSDYPVDRERVYIAGYSQGGQTAESTLMRAPHLITAAAPCGSFVFRTYDNWDVPFTMDEAERLQHVFVPVMQMSGACEASHYGRVNTWVPRMDFGYHVRCDEAYENPTKNDMLDPTKFEGKMSRLCTPPGGWDVNQWMIGRLNLRMQMLNCKPRDADTCISYLDIPEDTVENRIHYKTGFYGDRESAPRYYGYEHYTIDVINREGITAYRFVTVENCPHWPPVMMGPLVWDFFKQYRRDSKTGKIVVDPYTA